MRGIRQRARIAKSEDSANESGVPVTCEKRVQSMQVWKTFVRLVLSVFLGGQVHIALGTVPFLPVTGLIYISMPQLANRH